MIIRVSFLFFLEPFGVAVFAADVAFAICFFPPSF